MEKVAGFESMLYFQLSFVRSGKTFDSDDIIAVMINHAMKDLSVRNFITSDDRCKNDTAKRDEGNNLQI